MSLDAARPLFCLLLPLLQSWAVKAYGPILERAGQADRVRGVLGLTRRLGGLLSMPGRITQLAAVGDYEGVIREYRRAGALVQLPGSSSAAATAATAEEEGGDGAAAGAAGGQGSAVSAAAAAPGVSDAVRPVALARTSHGGNSRDAADAPRAPFPKPHPPQAPQQDRLLQQLWAEIQGCVTAAFGSMRATLASPDVPANLAADVLLYMTQLRRAGLPAAQVSPPLGSGLGGCITGVLAGIGLWPWLSIGVVPGRLPFCASVAASAAHTYPC